MFDTHPVLHTPEADIINDSNLQKYVKWLEESRNLQFGEYENLWEWSVSEPEDFWLSITEYFDVRFHDKADRVLSSHEMPGAKWFEGATLNYAEHLLRNRCSDHPALIFKSETNDTVSVSWNELATKTAAVQQHLKNAGIGKGDRVAAYLPNIPEAVICFIAVSALGAVWSCCSPDFGVNTVVDRFEQIRPDVLIAADGYRYNGKEHYRTEETRKIRQAIDSIREVITIPYLGGEQLPDSGMYTPWAEVLSSGSGDLHIEPVDFSHPLWVLYSSGTTGKPKAITHSHGGVLLEHLKYLSLQNDVKRGERFFWFTTTGWMMWNFLQASMLVGAVPVLYEGSPSCPDLNALWKIAGELPIHHFGTSAPFLTACMKKELNPGQSFDLSALRSIGSTGAPLPPEAFDWVYEAVKEDVWLCSMSGGTDVCTAFVGGIVSKPVKRGLIQGRALGCDLHACNDKGEPVLGSLGEMVIGTPMPSMPVYFWGDENHTRYRESYFEPFPGKWCHGDWINMYADGQLIILGRSDATLNRKGIRIGTAEIYAILDQIPEIEDALIINLESDDGNDTMPLFIVCKDKHWSEDLKNRIRETLKKDGSPRHVPDQILQVPDIPYTLSGKKMEVPVKKLLMGMDISGHMNKDACRNPATLQYFKELSGQIG